MVDSSDIGKMNRPVSMRIPCPLGSRHRFIGYTVIEGRKTKDLLELEGRKGRSRWKSNPRGISPEGF